jgi:hypothetical protein
MYNVHHVPLSDSYARRVTQPSVLTHTIVRSHSGCLASVAGCWANQPVDPPADRVFAPFGSLPARRDRHGSATTGVGRVPVNVSTRFVALIRVRTRYTVAASDSEALR